MAVRLPIVASPSADGLFDKAIYDRGAGPLLRDAVSVLQINVGKRCNQACHHCHVDAGPKRTEVMSEEVLARVLELLAGTPSIHTVDITGGAPELHPQFRRLVCQARRLGHDVIDRCNLTILLEPGMESLGPFLAAERVHIVASLPCYSGENVDKQRGRGVFEKSIRALQLLGALGYGKPDSDLHLDLVYNPGGAFLPPPQEKLELRYKEELRTRFGIEFNRLLTITNMPINRFAHSLRRSGQYEPYLALLRQTFNPATVLGLMCRTQVSVGYDGKLYDCDFNQMLELAAGDTNPAATIWDIDSFAALQSWQIATRSHCFGCTAGSGSSCGGSLDGGAA